VANEFLGVGWGFPIAFDDHTRTLELAVHDESIRQSIRIILETARGERVMRPGFGCGLQERVFDINNVSTRAAAADDVREALRRWEPRIEVLDVVVTAGGASDEILNISIDYRVRSTDNRFNLVYPFYLDRSAV